VAALEEHFYPCPYCGERIEVIVDDSAGDQRYIEDCQVCCRPIELEFAWDGDMLAYFVARTQDG